MVERPSSMMPGIDGTRTRIPRLDFPDPLAHPPSPHLEQIRSNSSGRLKFPDDPQSYPFTSEDLEDHGEIGRGQFGTVNHMVHNASRHHLAVKRIRSTTVNPVDQKKLLMELDAIMKSEKCENIVKFYGAIFHEGDCWICMELMNLSLDTLYKHVYEVQAQKLPEALIGNVAVSTLKALNYLKKELSIIHRDVKPSNILLNVRGMIKLCDFGIAGQLVDSIAKTQDAGCRPYMAPERLSEISEAYDVRSDVWSLGITLVEIATGRFPYTNWTSVFDQLAEVVRGDAPLLHTNHGYSQDMVFFVNNCLIKAKDKRPKYEGLMSMPFFQRYDFTGEDLERARTEVGIYVKSVIDDNTAFRNRDLNATPIAKNF